MVKTRLQVTNGMYSGILNCFRTIVVKEGGIRALYRGLSANLVGVAPEKSIKLVSTNRKYSTILVQSFKFLYME
jgi:hypothetical protein